MVTGLLYLLLGMFAGVAAGLLGIGGGLIIVPVLVFIFQQQQFSSEVIVHLAVGTSLATIVLTSISSVRSHHQHGAVQWPVFVRMAPAIVLGAVLGSVIADEMPTRVLKWVFAIFELTVATQMILAYRPNPHRVLPNWPGLSLAGTVIGAVSAVVGIGGGTMTVPFLVWCNVAMRKAVATAAACGLPIALAGAAGFILNGWNEPALPAWSSGYVYWPAFAGIVATSVLFAPLGARLAHRLPAAQLKRIFALLLYALGIRMLLG
ncbi:sulfite exporter TauE/SafE family protein [Thiohalophilus sp.]|uniref:sulfite exporter TauE/SafE family protein n=1 Tax=Thiohalophilus sp. TaxID=3028392 RepID=UPI002ACEDADF|nr:sulfite exporter TauE/SafE family protein [Thiohalophilus sp.]MDZ7804888.1 sulfite exporter TauE/SafE family protein [Thiohalophilus sp.]